MKPLPPDAWNAKLAEILKDKNNHLIRQAGNYATIEFAYPDEGATVEKMLEPDGTLTERTISKPKQAQEAIDVKAEIVTSEPQEQARGSFEVSNILGVPKELVVNLNGRLFVTQAGLLLKAERKGGYRSMHAEITTEVKDEKGQIIGYEATGYIYPEISSKDIELLKLLQAYPQEIQEKLLTDLGRPYKAIATATKQNVKMTSMHSYLKELACTRAINRVLRLYTSCGFCSDSELDTYNEPEGN